MRGERPTTAEPDTAEPAVRPEGQATPLRGASARVAENMEASLAVPTATSYRTIPVKLLEENREVINESLASGNRGKISYTHVIAWAVVRALGDFPNLNSSYAVIDGTPHRIAKPEINLGVAVDLEAKDGTRRLVVPNIKNAARLSFADFVAAYDDVVARARRGALQPDDFRGSTISLTNPGTVG